MASELGNSIPRDLSPDELAATVERAQSGEDAAWEQLFHRSYPRLFAYASQRLPSAERAQDAVAESLTRAVGSIERLRNDGAGFDAWMYGIIRHVVIDDQRSAFREGPGLVPEVPDTGPEPEDSALDREDAEHMREAFRRLDTSDRELLELRVLSERSADEVASELGRRPGAVRMAQSRALGRLRDLLDEQARLRARRRRRGW